MAKATKFTPERVERFLQAVRLGSTFRLAAQYAGFDHATFYRWLERDATFATQVKEAEGAAVVGWLAKIEKAANDGAWQAAAWKMERRYPDDFGRRERIEQTVEVSGHLDTGPDERLESRITSLAASFRAAGLVGESDDDGEGAT